MRKIEKVLLAVCYLFAFGSIWHLINNQPPDIPKELMEDEVEVAKPSTDGENVVFTQNMFVTGSGSNWLLKEADWIRKEDKVEYKLEILADSSDQVSQIESNDFLIASQMDETTFTTINFGGKKGSIDINFDTGEVNLNGLNSNEAAEIFWESVLKLNPLTTTK